MNRREYNQATEARERLAKVFRKKLTVMNQPVCIRDLYVYPKKYEFYFGEYLSYGSQRDYSSTFVRLIQHVKYLANIANAEHEKMYCVEDENQRMKVKADCLNKVTRLSLPEFSLYTHAPLTLEEYSTFVAEVEKAAGTMHENVHLLLSSFAVVNSHNDVMNMSLYVECGEHPRVHPFCKGEPSSQDVFFGLRSLHHNPGYSEFITAHNADITSNNCVLQLTTAGGAQFIQAIDVCLDHARKRSMHIVEEAIKQNVEQDVTLLPEQVNHVVTSNSITITHEITTDKAHQVDPRKLPISLRKVETYEKGPLVVTADVKNKVTVRETDIAIEITNPIFGGDLAILMQNERPLGKFTSALRSACEDRNNHVIEHLSRTQLDNSKSGHNFLLFSAKVDNIKQSLQQIEHAMTLISGVNFLQRIFQTSEDKMRTDIRNILQSGFVELKALLEDLASLVANGEEILHKMRHGIIERTGGIKYQFTEDMIEMIDKTIRLIEDIKFKPEEGRFNNVD